MPKKIKDRDEWKEVNGYKVFHEPVCATCQNFTLDMGFDHDIQGICEVMADEGGKVNCYVSIIAVCNRYKPFN